MRGSYYEIPFLGEQNGAPFSFVGRFLSLCHSPLSTEMPSSSCLLACHLLDLKLDGFYVCIKHKSLDWMR